MEKILEIGIKEGQLATLHSSGIAVYKDRQSKSLAIYLTFPLAISLKLFIEPPTAPDPIFTGSKWWWFDIKFSWYRFFKLEIEIPFWRNSREEKNA